MAQSDARIIIAAIRLSPLKSASKFNLVALKTINPTAIMERIIEAIFIIRNLFKLLQTRP